MTAPLYPTFRRLALALVLGSVAACSKDASRGATPFVPADRDAVRRETAALFAAERDAAAPARVAPEPAKTLPEGHPEPSLVLDQARLLEVRAALIALGKTSPPGYPSWEPIALDGAEAARRGDMAGTRASCMGCHERHAEHWRVEHPRVEHPHVEAADAH
jgi:hypothetical protein